MMILPAELIQAISHELKSTEDTKSFRLTCKQTNQALAAEVLRCITVDINKENLEKELYKLQYLAEASTSCFSLQGIRQVNVKSLSPVNLARGPRPSAEEVETAKSELECYEKDLKKYLYNALSSLTNVRTIKWTPTVKDSEWAQNVVIDAIKTLPNLQTLSIELPNCQIEIPFHFFTALQHISVHDVGDEEGTFKNFIKMISQSPLLESIHFSNSNDHNIRPGVVIRSLHQLFKRYPDDENGSIPPLRLKHLSLARCLVRLDDDTVMRHLRHLTSLSLQSVVESQIPDYFLSVSISDYEGGDASYNDCIAQMVKRDNRWASSYEQIWGTIQDVGLRLEEITLDRVPSAFLKYIGSYSGLKKLKIGIGYGEDEIASGRAAKKFYEVLERHASSMEELDINAYYEGLWCFGHHNKALFSTMRNLTRLRVKVQSSDILPISEPWNYRNEDIIKVLIDTAVMNMPQLQVLSVFIADQEDNLYDMYYGLNGTEEHFSRYSRKITARVLKYTAPRDCKRLPMFRLGSRSERVFVGQSEDLLKKGERLRYLGDSESDNTNKDSDEEG